MFNLEINSIDFFNTKWKNLPDHVRHCYARHIIPNPTTGVPEERRFTCNDFRNCRTCFKFRRKAHKDKIIEILEQQDCWLFVTNNVTVINRVKREVKADDYKRYPLDDTIVAFVLAINPDRLTKSKDDGYTSVTKLNKELVNTTIGQLVKTPKGSRVSGSLFTTNERLNKEKEEGQVLHLTSPQPDLSAENKEEGIEKEEKLNKAVAKTIVQTSGWQPDSFTIESFMKKWLSILRENYTEQKLEIIEDKKIYIKVKDNKVNWLDFSENSALMSITDLSIYSALIDIKRLYNKGEFEKIPPPSETMALIGQ